MIGKDGKNVTGWSEEDILEGVRDEVGKDLASVSR
jgi:hypothetical protein